MCPVVGGELGNVVIGVTSRAHCRKRDPRDKVLGSAPVAPLPGPALLDKIGATDSRSVITVTLYAGGYTLGKGGGESVVHPYTGGALDLLLALDAQIIPGDIFDLLVAIPNIMVMDGAVVVELRDHRLVAPNGWPAGRVRRVLVRPSRSEAILRAIAMETASSEMWTVDDDLRYEQRLLLETSGVSGICAECALVLNAVWVWWH